MKEVYINYNPYSVETEIKVAGYNLEDNSWLKTYHRDRRLQEWVDELPSRLHEECNDDTFSITFHGTALDYEDMQSSFQDAEQLGTIKRCQLTHEPAIEAADKVERLKEIFERIQKECPPALEGALKSDAVQNAFTNALNNEFEVCVVATMSAGKSTLINALLGKKLMPSMQEACTAIITRIKDEDVVDSVKGASFRAVVLDKEGKSIASTEKLTLSEMENFNKRKDVSEVRIVGDIPFVSSEETSLVLIDTPGPNNARDENHKRIQENLLNRKSKALVLYIMTSEFGTNDDDATLRAVAISMKDGEGRQSRDRFIFVVNKLDGREGGDVPVEETLERVRAHLKIHGIENPNIFPTAALPAANIRLLQQIEADGLDINDPDHLGEYGIDENDLDQTLTTARKLNRSSGLHLERKVTLPQGIKNDIEQMLNNTRDAWAQNHVPTDRGNLEEALIHTGIPCVEAAIRQYVEKYAVSAKIKNIVDTFMGKLEEAKTLAELKDKLARCEIDKVKISEEINKLKSDITNSNEAMNFHSQIDNKINDIYEDIGQNILQIGEQFQGKLNEHILNARYEGDIYIEDIPKETEKLRRFCNDLYNLFRLSLRDAIEHNMEITCETIVNQYKQKLDNLQIDVGNNIVLPRIDLTKMIAGAFSMKTLSDDVLHRFEKSIQVECGEEWVENTDKAWYKPWTWFQESGYFRKKYETKRYVSSSEFCQYSLQPIQKEILDKIDDARKYAEKKIKELAGQFTDILANLDNQLQIKLQELDDYVTRGKTNEDEKNALESQLKWLENITNDVNNILKI